MLSEDGKLSVVALALAEKIGISAKAIEKHLANLKADGLSSILALPKVDIGGLNNKSVFL